MLDTNAASDLMLGEPAADALVLRGDRIVISAVTTGELAYGIARRRGGRRLVDLLSNFLSAFETLPWTIETAGVYGAVRADCTRRGRSIGALDLLIAAHALSVDATLATRDASFARLKLADLKLITH